MSLIELIILFFFDVFAIHVVTLELLKENKSLKRVIFYGGLFGIISASIGYLIDVEIISVIINAIFMTSMIIVIYRKPIFTSVYLYIISSIIILISQLMVILALGYVLKGFKYNFGYGILSQILGIVLVVLMTKLLPLSILYNYLQQNNKVFKQIMINVFIILFTIQVYWYLNFDGIIENLILILLIVVLLLFINLAVIKNGLKNQFLERELLIYKTYNPIIEELIDEIRGRQHDFDNHLHALNTLLSNSQLYDHSDVSNYMRELKGKNNLGSLIKLQSKLVASILFSKKRITEQKNIPFIIDIKEYGFNKNLKEIQIVEMISILLDNAIEANVNDNRIIIKIYREENRNAILVQNKHPYLPQQILNDMFKKGFSTKDGQERGYGLYNLKKIMSEEKGEIIVKNEKIDDENYVTIKLLL